MIKPIANPEILTASKNSLDVSDQPLWDMPEVLGLETCALLIGSSRSIRAHSLSHFKIWIQEEGIAKSLDLATFVRQFPSYAAGAAIAIDTLTPWDIAEAMDKAHDITVDGEDGAVIVLFTPKGVAAWLENTESLLDIYTYEAGDGDFDDIEEAQETFDDNVNPGLLCSLFKPANLSAHDEMKWKSANVPVFDIWKHVMTGFDKAVIDIATWEMP